MNKLLLVLVLAALLLPVSGPAETFAPDLHTSLDYSAVLADPEAHIGEKYDLSGSVVKAQKTRVSFISNWSNPYQILMSLADAPNNIIWVLCDCPSGYDCISHGDSVRFTGACQGSAEIAVSTGGTTYIPFFVAGTLFITE